MGFLLLLKICGPAELPVPGLGFVWGLANQLRVGLHQAKSHRGVRPAVRKANLGEKSAGVQRFARLLMEMKNGVPPVSGHMFSRHNISCFFLFGLSSGRLKDFPRACPAPGQPRGAPGKRRAFRPASNFHKIAFCSRGRLYRCPVRTRRPSSTICRRIRAHWRSPMCSSSERSWR